MCCVLHITPFFLLVDVQHTQYYRYAVSSTRLAYDMYLDTCNTYADLTFSFLSEVYDLF